MVVFMITTTSQQTNALKFSDYCQRHEQKSMSGLTTKQFNLITEDDCIK